MMQRLAMRLKALVDQLLSFSRHSDQAHPQVVEEIDLEPFLRKLLGRYGHELAQKRVLSECRVEPGLILRSDAILLQRIFDYLVANAVKFTESGQVQLIAESIGDASVAISVTDTGIGIPQDVQPRIYDRFEQGFDYETRRYEGAGISLALVKQTVEQLHGVILLQSAPGKGSRFTVILPGSDVITASDLASEWESGRTGAFDDRPWIAQAPSPAAVPPPVIAPVKASLPKEDGDRARVLVVDDDRANRMVVNRHLRSEYTILEAENGEQSLAVVSGQPVDLVLLDLMMPGLFGFDVLEHIKNNPEKEASRYQVA